LLPLPEFFLEPAQIVLVDLDGAVSFTNTFDGTDANPTPVWSPRPSARVT
jgi:hypothetical protein